MDNFEELEWEALPPLSDSPDELKQIRKNMRIRSVLIVLTSLVLAAALLTGILFVGIPAAEKMYWNPETNTHDIEYTNDLELTLVAYSELFSPSQTVSNVTSERTGFASYNLSVQMYENYGLYDVNYRTATIKHSELVFPPGFWDYESMNTFERASYPTYDMGAEFDQRTREDLEKLPDYVAIRAMVSFPEDLSMEELIVLRDSLEDGYIEWVGIRNSPENTQCYPLCGMKPFMGGLIRDQANEIYPCFDVKSMDNDAENLETHFKSLLQLSLDQFNADTGIDAGDNYYQRVLDYVEEKGVYSYGCYVVGPPELFLELMDSGAASQVWLQDAWIDV